MGIFNRKPKSEKAPVTGKDSGDVIGNWLRNDDQDKDGFMQREFERGKKLMESNDMDIVHQGYDIIGPIAAMGYIPAKLQMGHFCEDVKGDAAQAARWFKSAADLGSPEGCRCYADMLMTGTGVETNMRQAFEYYEKAAVGGIPEAMFVMGEYCRNNGLRDKSIDWYTKSYQSGYEPAQIRIQQMKSGKR